MDMLKIKKLSPNAVAPTRATNGSAGYDLSACIDSDITIPPNGRCLIPTGIAIAIPDSGMAGFVFGRSGLGTKHGITPSNSVGVIDSDYRGELTVGLANHSDTPYTIRNGDRIAQLVLMPVLTPQLIECEELDETARGTGGFGSSGK